MKQGTRLYINLTNKCNVSCPFCCMYSDENKNSFLNFDTFKDIIDSCEGNFELQLEGGEPLIHSDIFLFIEYAIHTNRCSKVIILTNGLLLNKYVKRFLDIKNWYNIPFEIKISINYYLLEKNPNHLKDLSMIDFSTEYVPDFDITYNVRKRYEDDFIEEELEKYRLLNKSKIFYFQSYGRLTGSKYDGPVIVQNIQDWKVYASDGTCFDQDLIARSEHEKELG